MVVADVHSNIGLWSGDPFIWSMTALLLIYQLTRNWVDHLGACEVKKEGFWHVYPGDALGRDS